MIPGPSRTFANKIPVLGFGPNFWTPTSCTFFWIWDLKKWTYVGKILGINGPRPPGNAIPQAVNEVAKTSKLSLHVLGYLLSTTGLFKNDRLVQPTTNNQQQPTTNNQQPTSKNHRRPPSRQPHTCLQPRHLLCLQPRHLHCQQPRHLHCQQRRHLH